MAALTILGALFLLPLAAFAVLAAGASLACWLLFKARILHRPWQFGAVFPIFAGAWPFLSILADAKAAAACRATMGDLELSCGGEIGGVMIFVFKALLVFAALAIGPVIGIRLGRSCLRAKGPITK